MHMVLIWTWCKPTTSVQQKCTPLFPRLINYNLKHENKNSRKSDILTNSWHGRIDNSDSDVIECDRSVAISPTLK